MLDALAQSRPGRRDKQRDVELEAARAEAERLRRRWRRWRRGDVGGGKPALGLSGRVPPRVMAVTKTALMDVEPPRVMRWF